MAPKKKPKFTKGGDPHTLAAILLYQENHGYEAAAKKFGMSRRSIMRRRQELIAGKNPALAKLMAQHKATALERVSDLLTETFDTILRRLLELLPNADIDQVLRATKTVGELRVARDVLNDPASNPAGESFEGDESRGGAAATGLAGSPPGLH